MRRHLALTTLFSALLLAGCGGHSRVNGPGHVYPSGDDRALIDRALRFQSELIEPDDSAPVDLVTPLSRVRGSAQAAPTALPAFQRRITRVERTFDVEFAEPDSAGRPTLAVVMLRRHLIGSVEFATPTPGPGGALGAAGWSQPLDDHWTRRVILRRILSPDPWVRLVSPWQVVSVSGVDIWSTDHMMDCMTCGTTAIASVRVESPASFLDRTIRDPLTDWPLEGWGVSLMRFDPGADVTITMEIRKDGDLAAIGYRAPWAVFTRTAPSVYTVGWKAPRTPGIYHLPLTVLAAEADSSRICDSVGWLLPYRVEPVVFEPPIKGR